jgi:hypothetical protein
MDNTYPPSGDGDPQDARRTDQFWTPAPGSSGHGPHDPAGAHDAAGPPPRLGSVIRHYTRDGRPKLRWTVGLSLAVVLAAAGVIGGVALASHAPASGFSQASDNAATHSGSSDSAAAQLNSVLSADGAPGALTLTSAPAVNGSAVNGSAVKGSAVNGSTAEAAVAAKVRACRRAVAALRAARKTGRPALIKQARAAVLAHCHGLRRRLARFILLRGIAGQFTIHTKQGLRTLAFERGVIQSAGHGVIVVRAVNGLTEAWHLVGSTVVREHGKKISASALTRGEPVWVGGPVLHGAKDARLIVIRPPAASSSAKPAPAASSGS